MKKLVKSYSSSMKRGLMLVTAFFSLLTVLSCQDGSGTISQGRPAAERTSVHYMLPAVQAAHKGITEAQKMLQKDPPDIAAARESLSKADGNLANLEWFYIPATEARENVYNAYLEQLAGHADKRNIYLDSAKSGLLQIAERSDSQAEPYIKDLTDRIESIQFHIRDGVPINEDLKSLCAIFQLHLLKAQLVIDEHSFDEKKPGD